MPDTRTSTTVRATTKATVTPTSRWRCRSSRAAQGTAREAPEPGRRCRPGSGRAVGSMMFRTYGRFFMPKRRAWKGLADQYEHVFDYGYALGGPEHRVDRM